MSKKIIYDLLPIKFCNIHRMNPCNSVNWMVWKYGWMANSAISSPVSYLSIGWMAEIHPVCIPNYQSCGSPTLNISKRNAVWFDISIVSPILWKFLHFTKLSKIKLFLILKLFLYRESMYKTISKNSIHWKEFFFFEIVLC